MKDKNSIVVGMSGGVDSSVAAYLLKKEGVDVRGLTISTFDDFDPTDAQNIANKLKIPFECINSKAEFESKVIENFVLAYESGITPNPCVTCNKVMKFSKLLEYADKLGVYCVATGHYAIIEYSDEKNKYLLKKAKDETKDQSYFLCLLSQDELSRIKFPLGFLTKKEIRSIAEKEGFTNAKKPDSQDVCFIPDGDFYNFIKKYRNTDSNNGSIIDMNGNVLGEHKGAIAYTLGQRKGLGLAMGEPVYVTDKDISKNTVTVGKEEDLYKNTVYVKNVNWIAIDECKDEMEASVKLRYSKKEDEAIIIPLAKNRVKLEFKKPQRAPAPGQAAVFYDKDIVIGGGIIEKAENTRN